MAVFTKTQQDLQVATTSKPKKASLEVVIEMVTLLIYAINHHKCNDIIFFSLFTLSRVIATGD
jgi:hypothetical protein